MNDKKQIISKSHERCALAGITPNLIFSRKIISDKDLKNKLEKNKELISISLPFMNELYNFVKGSGFFLVLTDDEGCILNLIGDKEILEESSKFKMVPGAYMDEMSVGTNAMSIALSEKVPIQLSGEEHFIAAYHRWTCSAAPIKNQEGKIIGALNLTGYSKNVHSHTLGMVVAAVNAIEKMLELKSSNDALALANKNIENIFNSISVGLLTADLSGNIKIMNKIAADMFGYKETEMKKIKIWDLIEDWNKILDTVYSKGSFVYEDVYVNALKNKLQYNLSVYPVYNSKMQIVEATYVFNEIKKGRKLAGRLLSSRAIYTFDKIVGKSQNFLKVIEYAKKISDSKSTIMLTGESGTGKEVFAQAIHNSSSRNDQPFIALNCGAIPRTLIESELFGYEEGAFTGAKRGGNAGKFELADEGTIFLDEIGEMPLEMQTRLLRVIEEGIITRIGGVNQIPVNVRIIAATNRELKEEVEKGNFRKDLFYRLNVLPVYLPPLRERRDDIPLLINYFMKKTSKHLNKRIVKITPDEMEMLKNYDWPGNIRELENVIELMINTELVSSLGNNNKDVQKNKIPQVSRGAEDNMTAQLDENNEKVNDEPLELEYIEKIHIIKVLKIFNGNISLAANALSIGRNTLYRKIEKYNIDCSIFEHSSNLEQ